MINKSSEDLLKKLIWIETDIKNEVVPNQVVVVNALEVEPKNEEQQPQRTDSGQSLSHNNWESFSQRPSSGQWESSSQQESSIVRQSTIKLESPTNDEVADKRESSTNRESTGKRESSNNRESPGEPESSNNRESTGKRESSTNKESSRKLKTACKRVPIERPGNTDKQDEKTESTVDRLGNTVDRTEQAVDRTEKALERTEKAVDRTEKVVDRIEKVVDRTEKAVDRTENAVKRTSREPETNPTTKGAEDNRFQTIQAVSSLCTDDIAPLAKIRKFTKRLMFALDELRSEIPVTHKYYGTVGDLIEELQWFLKDLNDSNGTYDQKIILLEKYNCYRTAYYGLRSRINGSGRQSSPTSRNSDRENETIVCKQLPPVYDESRSKENNKTTSKDGEEDHDIDKNSKITSKKSVNHDDDNKNCNYENPLVTTCNIETQTEDVSKGDDGTGLFERPGVLDVTKDLTDDEKWAKEQNKPNGEKKSDDEKKSGDEKLSDDYSFIEPSEARSSPPKITSSRMPTNRHLHIPPHSLNLVARMKYLCCFCMWLC